MTFSDTTSATAGTISFSTSTSAGTGLVMHTPETIFDRSPTINTTLKTPSNVKRLGPKLYFKYVKSKLTTTKQKDLKRRLAVLQKEIEVCADIGQIGLYEQLASQLVTVVRESELYVMGISHRLKLKDIKRFMDRVSEPGKVPGYGNRIIHLEKLENFPRPIPAKVRTKIKSIQKCDLFNELWVLYLDYTGKGKAKTTKDKIREKDPILFGVINENPDCLYFIADWIDDQCDLTLDKILETKAVQVKVSDIPKELSRETLEPIKADILKRSQELKETKPSNFKSKMKKQDALNDKLSGATVSDMPLWKRVIRFFG